MTATMLALSTFVLAVSTPVGNPPPKAPPAPIRVWLSDDGDFMFGDRARAFVQSEEDGYVVVLMVDPEGRIRPLFPLQPGEDHFVRAGKKVELRGHGGREAFMVDDTTGRGAVIAAFSKSPFGFNDFTRNGHWDYRALADSTAIHDPEAAVLDIVHKMQPAERYEYDLATYVVTTPRYARRGRGTVPWIHTRPGLWWPSHYYARPGVSFSIGFGSGFGRYRYYDSFYYRYRRPFGWWAY